MTALAVLNIIFGAFWLFGLFNLIILLIMPLAPPAWMGRDYVLIMSIPGYRTYSMVGSILSVSIGVLLLACGIGLLRLRDV